MASVSDGGDNKLNVELNLVPFIDLLSSLVLFLLVTAVWEQIGSIPASVESSGKATISMAEQNNLTIHLGPGGFTLTWPRNSKKSYPTNVSNIQGKFDFEKLQSVLSLFPKEKAMPIAAVSSDDSVEYGMVISAIDAAKKSGFTSVALSTN